jgi:hypothetical protein
MPAAESAGGNTTDRQRSHAAESASLPPACHGRAGQGGAGRVRQHAFLHHKCGTAVPTHTCVGVFKCAGAGSRFSQLLAGRFGSGFGLDCCCCCLLPSVLTAERGSSKRPGAVAGVLPPPAAAAAAGVAAGAGGVCAGLCADFCRCQRATNGEVMPRTPAACTTKQHDDSSKHTCQTCSSGLMRS